ncbi:hypothetical protein AX16_010184 [Volvariella volvacea WC 439]|nr:hypothetical protein AX16_010184 [Volvariella volvacea WC 439]
MSASNHMTVPSTDSTESTLLNASLISSSTSTIRAHASHDSPSSPSSPSTSKSFVPARAKQTSTADTLPTPNDVDTSSVDSITEAYQVEDESLTPRKRTPLPIFQLFIIYTIMFAEPVTAMVIYPFVNQLIQETGITHGDERKTGYFGGILESTFFVTEAITVVYWGMASDIIGRRPILVLGPLGLTVAMFGFGLSKKFLPLLCFRALQGVFNGNIGVSKSVLAELTDETNMAEAFAIMPLVWSVGIAAGPIVGGLLARPADRWPHTLGRFRLMKDYPYLLACGTAGVMSFLSYLLTLVGFKETLPALAAKKKSEAFETDAERTALLSEDTRTISYGASSSSSSAHTIDADTKESEKPLPIRKLLIPRVLVPLTAYLFLSFTDMAAEALRPLMFSTSIQNGGLGFSPYEIGLVMGAWGTFNAFVQIALAAKLMNRFGPKKVFIVSNASLVGTLSVFPLLSYFAKSAGKVDSWVWAGIGAQLLFMTSTYMAYGCIHLFIVNSAPNKASLGTTNGLAQMMGCVVRSFSPTVSTSLFSISLQHHLAGGMMVYWVLITIALIGVRVSFFLPDRLHAPQGR